MNVFKPEHAAVWFEIPVTNLGRAKKFYEAVTLMSLREDNTGPNPMMIFETKTAQSGVAGHLYPGKPSAQSGSTIHLAVPQPLDAALERVREHGGKVVSDVISIPPGRFAYCEDPDGNSIGLFTPN